MRAYILILLAMVSVGQAGLIPYLTGLSQNQLLRTPTLDNSISQQVQLGRNFAYSTAENHAYTAISPSNYNQYQPIATFDVVAYNGYLPEATSTYNGYFAQVPIASNSGSYVSNSGSDSNNPTSPTSGSYVPSSGSNTPNSGSYNSGSYTPNSGSYVSNSGSYSNNPTSPTSGSYVPSSGSNTPNSGSYNSGSYTPNSGSYSNNGVVYDGYTNDHGSYYNQFVSTPLHNGYDNTIPVQINQQSVPLAGHPSNVIFRSDLNGILY